MFKRVLKSAAFFLVYENRECTCTRGWRKRSFEQRHEACLLKMSITGECFANAFTFHDDEADAICQRPLLIRPVGIERDSSRKNLCRWLNDANERVIMNQLHQVQESSPVVLSKGVADFRQHPGPSYARLTQSAA